MGASDVSISQRLGTLGGSFPRRINITFNSYRPKIKRGRGRDLSLGKSVVLLLLSTKRDGRHFKTAEYQRVPKCVRNFKKNDPLLTCLVRPSPLCTSVKSRFKRVCVRLWILIELVKFRNRKEPHRERYDIGGSTIVWFVWRFVLPRSPGSSREEFLEKR